MDEKNSAYLTSKYPDLFHSDFWFEVGDGWTKLLDNMLGEMQRETQLIPGGAIIQMDQIKSKFGGLRVYWSLLSEHDLSKVCERLHNAVTKAEHLAQHTCAKCSAYGSTSQKNGWVDPLCSACEESTNE